MLSNDLTGLSAVGYGQSAKCLHYCILSVVSETLTKEAKPIAENVIMQTSICGQ